MYFILNSPKIFSFLTTSFSSPFSKTYFNFPSNFELSISIAYKDLFIILSLFKGFIKCFPSKKSIIIPSFSLIVIDDLRYVPFVKIKYLLSSFN